MSTESGNGVAIDSHWRGLSPGADPMDRVLGLEGRSSNTTMIAGTVLALVFHFGLAAEALTMSIELREWSRIVRDRVALGLQDLYEVDLAKPPEPPPPPPPEVKEDKAPTPPPPPAAKAAEPPPPPPAAAQAGRALVAEGPPSDEVADFTMTQGTAATYAGGVTQSAGTSKTAVANPSARATGTPAGTGAPTAAPAPVVDKSRPAGLLGSTDWNCSSFWPSEADSEQIDQALVTIQVTVGPDGKPQKVDVIKDPGHGFGTAAKRCAMRESFQTALDPTGQAIVSQTKPFRVRFER